MTEATNAEEWQRFRELLDGGDTVARRDWFGPEPDLGQMTEDEGCRERVIRATACWQWYFRERADWKWHHFEDYLRFPEGRRASIPYLSPELRMNSLHHPLLTLVDPRILPSILARALELRCWELAENFGERHRKPVPSDQPYWIRTNNGSRFSCIDPSEWMPSFDGSNGIKGLTLLEAMCAWMQHGERFLPLDCNTLVGHVYTESMTHDHRELFAALYMGSGRTHPELENALPAATKMCYGIPTKKI